MDNLSEHRRGRLSRARDGFLERGWHPITLGGRLGGGGGGGHKGLTWFFEKG